MQKTIAVLIAVLALAPALAACGDDAAPVPLEPGDVDLGGGDSTSGGETADIEPAPAFAPEDLTDPPRENWLTYGGTTFNQRYSPLDAITPENVGRLAGRWRIRLGSGFGERFSQEASPVVFDGVIYQSTAANDVFAIDVETGEVLWTYRAGLRSRDLKALCCAWNNRGVAIGDGRVYILRLDAKAVALDQRTGRVLWERQVERPERGFSFTNAPLYWDGLLITGISGGEYGIRGRVYAFDAGSGEERWRFYTVPGPGEPNHDSWPQDNNAWRRGGAPVWQVPALDPDLGLLYLQTGNPGPLFGGADRAGDNLYANSVVAVEARTGEYRWHYQFVRHDLWDYDNPTPPVLFDLEIDGAERQALAQTSKTGWVYVLDRRTGEPLLPIDERAVPQLRAQATAATQPFPEGDAYVPQSIPSKDARRMQEQATNPEEWRYVNDGRIFTPTRGDEGVIAKPATLGGSNWPPNSYSPQTGYLYVCASDTVSIYGWTEEQYDAARIAEGKQFLASAFAAPSAATLKGTFTAMDMRTNRIVWQKRWNGTADNCYSGSVATGGGLVFVGRNDGRLLAYDASDGDQAWEYQTGAGANAPPVVFEHDGRQHVLLLSGGNAIAGSSRGDILTLFELDGDVEPAEAGRPSTRGTQGGRTDPPTEDR